MEEQEDQRRLAKTSIRNKRLKNLEKLSENPQVVEHMFLADSEGSTSALFKVHEDTDASSFDLGVAEIKVVTQKEEGEEDGNCSVDTAYLMFSSPRG